MKKILSLFLVLLAAVVARGQFNAPDFGVNVPETNGTVLSFVQNGNTLYMGGSFTYVGPHTGSGVVLNKTTGQVVSTSLDVNGVVMASVADGSGGYFIGGNFTHINGVARANLAHITSSHTLDMTWDPGTDGQVRAMAINGTNLYVGGDFQHIGPDQRSFFAEISTTTGVASPIDFGVDNTVNSIATNGSQLYLGGAFSSVLYDQRSNLACISLSNYGLTNLNLPTNGAVLAMALVSTNLYIGGEFTEVNGTARGYIARISTTTEQLATFIGSFNSTVTSLIFSGATLYVGGYFTQANNNTRNRLAALNSSGTLLSWNPNVSEAVRTMALSGSTLYIGGNFDQVGGIDRYRFAAVSTTTGAPTSLIASVGNPPLTIIDLGTNIFMGGEFSSVGGERRERIAAIDVTTGQLSPWSAVINDDVNSMVISGNTLYLAGRFSFVNGSTRGALASFDLTTGNLLGFNGQLGGSANDILLSGNTLYVGGSFGAAGGQGRSNLAAFNLTTGQVTSWNPTPDGSVADLEIVGNTLYAAGHYYFVNGQPREHLSSYDLSNNGQLTSFSLPIDGSLNKMELDGTNLFLIGNFTSIGGQNRRYIASINTTNGQVTSWTTSNNERFSTIKINNGVMYLGINPDTYHGLRQHAAAVNATTGQLLSWDPSPNLYVFSFHTVNNMVFMGGNFSAVGTYNRSFFTRLSAASACVQPAQPTISAGGPTTFCTGGSVTLTAPAGFSYAWSNGATTQSINVTTGGSYTVQTIAAGCTSAASTATVVTVNTPPAQPSISAGGPTTFCTGGSVTLTAPAGFSYLWSNSATTQSINATSAGSYTVRTIANGCTSVASAAVVVTLTPLPTTPTISAGGPTTFCSGGSVTLTAPAGFSYLWSNNATTQSINVTTAGSYTVRTIASGCTSAASAATVVTVNPTPNAPALVTVGGAAVLCGGNTLTLAATGGSSYLWSTGATTANINVTTPGTYTARMITGSCTSAVSTPINVVTATSVDQPTISVSGPTTFCDGGSVTLTAPEGFSYLWSNNLTTRSINVTTSGSYTVRTIAGSCTSVASAPVVVTTTTLPTTPTISAGGPTTICSGSSLTLTSSAGPAYLWSTGATTQSINVTTAGSYTVRVINSGCTSSTSAATVVSVTTSPSTPTITASGPVNFCSGGSVTLSAPTGFSYLWSNNATTRTISVNSTGSYSVRTIASGCTSAVSNVIDVVALSASTIPAVTASGPTSFCSGNSVTLTAPSGFSYLWSNNATTQSVNVTAAGSYTVRTILAGCTSAASAATVVSVTNAPATPTITASGSTNLCSPETVTLTAPAGFNYLWSNGETTQSILVSSAGNYTCRTIANGCTSAVSNTIGVSVRFAPFAKATISVSPGGATAPANVTICQGETVTLFAGPSPLTTNFIWSTGQTTTSIDVSTAGTYTVRGHNSSQFVPGCTSEVSEAIVVTVIGAAPTITASGSPTICPGGSVTLSAPPSPSYLWSNGATTQSINATTAGSYTVRVISGACTSAFSAATVVSVASAPSTPIISASGTTTLCNGASVTLTAPAGFSYLWSNSATTQSINVSTAGSYTVRTIAGGCTSAVSAATVVTANTTPSTPTISASGPTSFCPGGSVTLTAPAGFSYLWSNNATTQSINVTTAGSYTVQTIAGGCTSSASAATVVTLNSPPSAPTITPAGSTVLCQNSSLVLQGPSGFDGYLWSNNATTQNTTVNSAGSYTLRVITNGCTSAVSSPVNVTTTFCVFAKVYNGVGNWTDAANWSDGTLPVSTDSVAVATGSSLTINTTATVKSITVQTGATVNIISLTNLTVIHRAHNLGTVNSTLNANGGLNMGGGAFTAVISGNRWSVNRLNLLGALRTDGDVDIWSALNLNSFALNANGRTIALRFSTLKHAELLQSAGAALTNAGSFRVDRQYPLSMSGSTGAWILVGAPTTGRNVTLWSQWNTYSAESWSQATTNGGSVYFYDPAFVAGGGYRKPLAAATAAPVGNGYRVWFTINHFTGPNLGGFSSFGAPKLGNHSWSLAYCSGTCAHNFANNGYNLIANPYAATLDWDAPTGWTRNNVFNAVYINRFVTGNCASYVNGVGNNGGSRYLPVGQGFFVWANAAGATMSVTPQAIAAGVTTPALRNGQVADVLRLNLVNESGKSDEAVLRFDGQATGRFDNAFEARKMANQSGLNFSYIDLDRAEYAIMAEPQPQVQTEYQLKTVVPQSGNYQIQFDGMASLTNNWSVFLKDNNFNALIPVQDGQAYSFNESAGATNRFSLVVMPAGPTNLASNLKLVMNLVPNPAKDVVRVNLSQSTTGMMTVTNQIGQVVISEQVNGQIHEFGVSKLAKGIYHVAVGGVVSKLVVE